MKYFNEGKSVWQIKRDLFVSRNTTRYKRIPGEKGKIN